MVACRLAAWGKRGEVRELETHFRELPYVPREKIEHILGLFSVIMDYIITKELVFARGNVALERLMAFLQDNVARAVTLAEASICFSRSRPRHFFTPKIRSWTREQ